MGKKPWVIRLPVRYIVMYLYNFFCVLKWQTRWLSYKTLYIKCEFIIVLTLLCLTEVMTKLWWRYRRSRSRSRTLRRRLVRVFASKTMRVLDGLLPIYTVVSFFLQFCPIVKVKQKRFWKVAWIRSHHLHIQWKFKWVPIQIMGGKVCLRCSGKTFSFQKFVDNTQPCWPYYLK